jgi:hypothetical protein
LPNIRAIGLIILGLTLAAAPQSQPQPASAVSVVLDAFARVPIVAVGVSHTVQDDDFILSIVRSPRFPAVVRNIVIECGNSRYQPILDRYVAGGDVPIEGLQLVWRNTTQIFGPCNDPHHRELIDAVRALNQRMDKTHQVRVLAGDPPINWAKVKTADEVTHFLSVRDSTFASIVQSQVLAKHESALLFVGGFHVFRRHSPYAPEDTVTEIVEKSRPGSTFVVMSREDTDGDNNATLDTPLSTWPVPSIAMLGGNWLGQTDSAVVFAARGQLVSDPNKFVNPFEGAKLADLADALLYLGPSSAAQSEARPPANDAAYIAELRRRAAIMGGHARVVPIPAPTP